ncbi:MAG: hypothetical protein K9M80_08500 [Candidatus Marinimicrobia bacterium]|nr:hypothetical protein [Candidatus Neomarinimicrobiota bacterium]
MTNSRKKGYIGEKKIRDYLKQNQYSVVWHNESPTLPDLTLKKNEIELKAEIKYQASVPKFLYKTLNQDETSDIGIVKRVSNQDRGRPWLVIMELDTFDEIIKQVKGRDADLKNKHKTVNIFE